MNDVRMIATDLDGTLLQRDGSILPETLNAMREASARGIVIALASGRYPENAALVIIDNGFSGPVMGSNGGIIEDGPMGQTLYLHTMRDETARAVRQRLDELNAEYMIFSHKRVTTSRVGLTHHSEISDGPRIMKLGGLRFGHGPEAVNDALRYRICKFYIYNHPNLKLMADELRKIPGILVTRSGEHNVEIMPEGVHKGRGIAELARWLGIPLSSVMAFGDEENDLPMLTTVGYGFAMGNAPEHVKAQCAHVTDSFEENGIGNAIVRYALNGGVGTR